MFGNNSFFQSQSQSQTSSLVEILHSLYQLNPTFSTATKTKSTRYLSLFEKTRPNPLKEVKTLETSNHYHISQISKRWLHELNTIVISGSEDLDAQALCGHLGIPAVRNLVFRSEAEACSYHRDRFIRFAQHAVAIMGKTKGYTATPDIQENVTLDFGYVTPDFSLAKKEKDEEESSPTVTVEDKLDTVLDDANRMKITEFTGFVRAYTLDDKHGPVLAEGEKGEDEDEEVEENGIKLRQPAPWLRILIQVCFPICVSIIHIFSGLHTNVNGQRKIWHPLVS